MHRKLNINKWLGCFDKNILNYNALIDHPPFVQNCMVVFPLRGYGSAVMSLNVGGCCNVLFHFGAENPARHADWSAGNGAFQFGTRKWQFCWRVSDWRGGHQRRFQIHGTGCSCRRIRVQNYPHHLAEEV